MAPSSIQHSIGKEAQKKLCLNQWATIKVFQLVLSGLNAFQNHVCTFSLETFPGYILVVSLLHQHFLPPEVSLCLYHQLLLPVLPVFPTGMQYAPQNYPLNLSILHTSYLPYWLYTEMAVVFIQQTFIKILHQDYF